MTPSKTFPDLREIVSYQYKFKKNSKRNEKQFPFTDHFKYQRTKHHNFERELLKHEIIHSVDQICQKMLHETRLVNNTDDEKRKHQIFSVEFFIALQKDFPRRSKISKRNCFLSSDPINHHQRDFDTLPFFFRSHL